MPQPDPRLLDHVESPALILERGQVRYVNSAARNVLGGHILNQDVRIALRDPKAIALLGSGEAGSVTLEGLTTPGSRWKLSTHALSEHAWLVLLEDLSIRVSVARAHADFVANASHELRTPLSVILGYVEMLSESRAGEDPETRKRFLGTIGHEARRMQALIEDLMSLSRIEALKHDTPTEPVDLVVLARECVGELGGRGAVSVTANCDSAIVAGDRAQLAQVLRNLVDNALKYGKPDGEVALSIERSDAGRIEVRVRDEGDGIAAEHLPRLTERFYRVDASRSREAGGTGLGLAIVKHIVERHRGRFDLWSKEGQGTTAAILLPSAPPD